MTMTTAPGSEKPRVLAVGWQRQVPPVLLQLGVPHSQYKQEPRADVAVGSMASLRQARAGKSRRVPPDHHGRQQAPRPLWRVEQLCVRGIDE